MLTSHRTVEAFLHTATAAARAGGRQLMRTTLRPEEMEVHRKGPTNFVTTADREVEELITALLATAYPQHAILGEESGLIRESESEFQWVVDPLDGTTNYIHGFPYFCISIACLERGRALCGIILDPTRNEEFTATRGGGAYLNGNRIRASRRLGLRDALLANSSHSNHLDGQQHNNLATYKALYKHSLTIRRTGSAALDLAGVAAGRLDGFWGSGLKPWDLAAGGLIIEEAGGLVSNYRGEASYLEGGHLVAAAAKCFKPLLQAVNKHLVKPGERSD